MNPSRIRPQIDRTFRTVDRLNREVAALLTTPARPRPTRRPPRGTEPHARQIRRRHWSAAELQLVRDGTAASETPAQLLARLPGRSLSSLYQVRILLGLGKPQKLMGPELDALIRRRHAEQWCGAEIAAEWNALHADRPERRVCRSAVAVHRRALGLVSNRLTERQRERVGAKTREQLAAAGLPSLAALHRKVIRERIAAQGWPAALRWREAQILSLIWERGPLTKREICAALGTPFRGAKGTLKANEKGGTYMATLMRRGLLVSFRRAVRHPSCGAGHRAGQGRNVDVYSLPLTIERRKVTIHEPHDERDERERDAGAGAAGAAGGPVDRAPAGAGADEAAAVAPVAA
ncbi:MAG: hypothetical protein JWO31_3776 [Phycisphaerales bacterium]|nr:hypothetical protein [Phycisphaerales bacterium]